ncbi:MAG: tRNA pseudouridine(13) synthase TruD [Planctomycetota bacterium]
MRRRVPVLSGEHRVYKVSRVKVTSVEAARELAAEAGVHHSQVSMAGLKDRQGITEQYMSIPRGREVFIGDASLRIESVGFAREAITSTDSRGNAFEVVARGLEETQLRRLRAGLDTVREFGVPNYFDEQRFGNLRHGQGWIALDLQGTSKAVCAACWLRSRSSSPRRRAAQAADLAALGRLARVAQIAGRFGRHHSVMPITCARTGDFAGAFTHVATRERVIHQFAFKATSWNRVGAWLAQAPPRRRRPRFALPGVEGR